MQICGVINDLYKCGLNGDVIGIIKEYTFFEFKNGECKKEKLKKCKLCHEMYCVLHEKQYIEKRYYLEDYYFLWKHFRGKIVCCSKCKWKHIKKSVCIDCGIHDGDYMCALCGNVLCHKYIDLLIKGYHSYCNSCEYYICLECSTETTKKIFVRRKCELCF